MNHRTIVLLVLGPLLLIACGDDVTQLLPDAPERSISNAMSADEAAGFEPVTGPRAFDFPRDHGSHPDQHIEWWYLTGHLFDEANGDAYGFQFTIFRTGLAREAPDTESPFATRDVWMGHWTIGDHTRQRFQFRDRFARGALGLAGAATDPFRVWVGPWELKGTGEEPFPMTLKARDGDQLGLDLRLTPEKPLVLQGERGFDKKGDEPGEASHYLQWPRLAAEGTLTFEGRTISVKGHSWKDHEWSTSVLGEDLVGWDWFAVQLEDGRELMLYRLRRPDGTSAKHSSGSIIEKDGTARKLKREQFAIEETGTWTSPESGVRYPARWTLRVPELDLVLDARPYQPDQELRLAVTYWEGALSIEGTQAGQPVRGRAFAELVGYTANGN